MNHLTVGMFTLGSLATSLKDGKLQCTALLCSQLTKNSLIQETRKTEKTEIEKFEEIFDFLCRWKPIEEVHSSLINSY